MGMDGERPLRQTGRGADPYQAGTLWAAFEPGSISSDVTKLPVGHPSRAGSRRGSGAFVWLSVSPT